MIKENLRPFKLAITKEKLTSLSGLALFGEYLLAIGLDKEIARVFPAPGSAKGYSAWEHILPLLLMLHAGGRTLEDLRKIGEDRGLLRLLGMKKTPSPDATGDWMRRHGLRGEGALHFLNRKLVKRALRRDKRDGHSLDIDATGIEAHKMSAKRTYKGYPGYMPILGHLREKGLVVAHEFREGGVSPNTGNLEFYERCKKAMPAGKPIKTFRADSAAYQWKLLDLLDDDKVKYAVGGHLDAATLEAIGTIPAKAWWPYNDGFVAETVHIMNKMKTSFRLIVFKKLKQGLLFEKDEPRYHVVASNREETAQKTLNWYHQRGEHSENRIKELKNDFAMERMPCGQFEANALFFAAGVLAYNLYKLFVNEALPASWRTRRAGSIRYALYGVAGKVVRTGGKLLLRVGESAYEMFVQIRWRVALLESG